MALDRRIAAGTLAAGVAHELNNPLTFTSANLELASEMLDEGAEPDLLRPVLTAPPSASPASPGAAPSPWT